MHPIAGVFGAILRRGASANGAFANVGRVSLGTSNAGVGPNLGSRSATWAVLVS